MEAVSSVLAFAGEDGRNTCLSVNPAFLTRLFCAVGPVRTNIWVGGGLLSVVCNVDATPQAPLTPSPHPWTVCSTCSIVSARKRRGPRPLPWKQLPGWARIPGIWQGWRRTADSSCPLTRGDDTSHLLFLFRLIMGSAQQLSLSRSH